MLLDLMARGLKRDGVTEFAVMSGRPPCVKLDGAYQPVAEYAVSDEELLELLMTLGGISFVDKLGPEAASWKSVETSWGGPIRAVKRMEPSTHASCCTANCQQATRARPFLTRLRQRPRSRLRAARAGNGPFDCRSE
jgi:hypothetical protein